MKKFAKVLSVVLAVMLLSVMFTGCVAKADKTEAKLDKKGYTVTSTQSSNLISKSAAQAKAALVGAAKVEDLVTGTKTEDGKVESVWVIYYKETADAKEMMENKDDLKKTFGSDDSDNIVVKRSGKVVIVGTKKAVKVVS